PGIIPPPCHEVHQLFLEGCFWKGVSGRANQTVLGKTRYSDSAFRSSALSLGMPLPARLRTVFFGSATHRFALMLGYPTVFIAQMFLLNRHSHARIMSALRFLLFLTVLLYSLCGLALPVSFAQEAHLHSAKAGDVEIWSRGPQQKRGDL